MKRVRFLSDIARDNHLTKAKGLFNKLKHEDLPGMLLFSSDPKFFVQVQKVNFKKIDDNVKSTKSF